MNIYSLCYRTSSMCSCTKKGKQYHGNASISFRLWHL